MVGVLLVGMIASPSEIESLWFLWLVMIGVGIGMGNHVYWEMFGRIRITIGPERLQLINVSNLSKHEVNIPLDDFRRLAYHEEDTFGTGRLYGFTSGNIILHYKNGQRRFGKGLTKRESFAIMRQIENEIKRIHPREE